MGRAALDDVGDIAVLGSVQIDDAEHIVQQLAGSAYEGFAFEVFLFARTFADEHDIRFPVTHTKDHIMTAFAQAAAGTGFTRRFQGVPIHIICSSDG
jgi:hypothetical protein